MSFHFQTPTDLCVQVRRIAHAELDKARSAVDGEEDRHEAVHEVRKKCKKIRALARIVRPALGDHYRQTNVWLRDTGRLLSELRDAQVAIETFDALVERYSKSLEAGLERAVRDALVERRDRVVEGLGLEERLARAGDRLVEARALVDGWPLPDAADATENFELLGPGLAKTYKRCRRRRRDADEDQRTEVLHQWRKRAKYHRYHVRLIRQAWPEALDPWRHELHRLTDLLGDDHDLAELAAVLVGEEVTVPEERRAPWAALIRQRRRSLQDRALALGRRVTAETPEKLRGRFAAYWRAWHRDIRRPTAMAQAAS